MSQFWQIILIVFGAIGTLGLFAGGFGALRASYKKGAKEERSEVLGTSSEIIKFWKEQSENLQIILDRKEKEWNEKFQILTREMGQIQGQLTAEKAQNERLEKIFQNRDPEMKEFMKYMIQTAENQANVNSEIVRVLGDIHSLVVSEEGREIKINATVTKTPS